jgi:hypothetical protein
MKHHFWASALLALVACLAVISPARAARAEGPAVAVVLESVSPKTLYPDDDTLVLSGRGFSTDGPKNLLRVVGKRDLALEWVAKDCDTSDKVCAQVQDGGTIELTRVHRANLVGPVKLEVRVGTETSGRAGFIMSRYTKSRVRLAAGIALFLVSALLGVLVWAGMTHRIPDGKKYGPFTALFIDPESDTYSLSKLQFYLWTLAAALGYVYVQVARTLVQGDVQLVDVSSGLPGLLALSASTGAMAIAIHGLRGSKGSGPIHPGFGDFLMTGGVVAAERVQLLVWTLLGCSSFLLVVFTTDPGDIQALPRVPEGLLLLMGVSSFGYLGGKISRQPGPIVDKVTYDPGTAKLDIEGAKLSPNASLLLDGALLALAAGTSLEVVDPAPEPGFAKHLRGTLIAGASIRAGATLVVQNADGQMSEALVQTTTAPTTTTPAQPNPTPATTPAQPNPTPATTPAQPSPTPATSPAQPSPTPATP